MARTVDTIQTSLVAALVTSFATIGVTIDPLLWSKRNMVRQLCYTVAVGMAVLEQLMDLFKADIELTVSKAAAASAKWVQDKMFKFQYSATNPQVIALVDTVPTYPTVDTTLRIITACSVTSDISNTVTIKAAKGSPLAALSAPELASAQGYINTIGMIGINYSVVSLAPDKLYIDAEVFYAGQYASVIQANVISTINTYLEKLSVTNFNGALKMTDLEAVIRNVTGVNDVLINNVRGRASTDLFSAGVDLVLNTAIIQRQYVSVAGYIAEENTAAKSFADTLIFTPQ